MKNGDSLVELSVWVGGSTPTKIWPTDSSGGGTSTSIDVSVQFVGVYANYYAMELKYNGTGSKSVSYSVKYKKGDGSEATMSGTAELTGGSWVRTGTSINSTTTPTVVSSEFN